MGAQCCCEEGADSNVAYISTETGVAGESGGSAAASVERFTSFGKEVLVLQAEAQGSTRPPPPAAGDRGAAKGGGGAPATRSPSAGSDAAASAVSPADAEKKRKQQSKEAARKAALEAAARARDPMLLPGGHRAGTAVEALQMQRLAQVQAQAEAEAAKGNSTPVSGGPTRRPSCDQGEAPIWTELSSTYTSESVRSFVSI